MTFGTPESFPPRWGLLADDLTGACDAGVQFARVGFSTVLLLAEEGQGSSEFELVIRSSNSRNDSRRAAAAKVLESGQRFGPEGRTLIYKKVDSTLKGNLAAEIQAAMQVCGASLALVAPAFPAMGRALENGWLRGIGGTVLPRIHLPALLREQGAARVLHLDQSILCAGLPAVLAELRASAAGEPRLVAADALTQEHLALLAQAARALDERTLLAGSAGLAAELAALLAAEHGRKKAAALRHPDSSAATCGVVLFIGSNNPVTLEQVDYLAAHRRATRLVLDGGSGAAAQGALQGGRHVLVMLKRNERLQRIAEFVSNVFSAGCRGLFFAGGDTAHLVCRAIGAQGIRLENEIALGLPWGRILGGRANGFAVAAKAGGFGNRQALATVVDFLAGAAGNSKS